MSAAAVLSHKHVQAYGTAAREALGNPSDLKGLVRTAELLIAEAARAATFTATGLDEFKEEVRQHQRGYEDTRRHLKATFQVARRALSQLNDLLLYVQSHGAAASNVNLYQKIFDQMMKLQEDFYEMLAFMDDKKLQQRISEAFKASPKGTGEPADWRSLVFDEEPQH